MKKVLFFILILALIFVSCTSLKKDGSSYAQNTMQSISGNYLFYDNDVKDFRLKKGNINIENGIITSIDEYNENQNNAIVLGENQLIFPGLMDLHSHTECNMMQMFSDGIIGDIVWDNRFEWKYSPLYFKEYKDVNARIFSKWNDTFENINSNLTIGDMVALYSELQAVAGGTVLIQEDGNDKETKYLDCHKRISLIRSTSCAEDICRDDNLPMQSVIRAYKPDAKLSSEDESSYMPHLETDWGVVDIKLDESSDTYMDIILNTIKAKDKRKVGGYLIHLAEGKTDDIYTNREFNVFMNRICEEVNAGNITFKDVRDTKIILIHACGVDLNNKEIYEFIKNCGISILWSPVSNFLLYKDTPDFYKYFDDENINVSIGSDWSPSGSKTIWDECRFALDYVKNQKNIGNEEITEFKKDLLKAITFKSAKILGSEKLGNIEVGKCADFLILNTENEIINDANEAINMFFSSDERNISMVYVNGKPIYGDKEYIDCYIKNNEFVWANVESVIPKLTNKYYNITEIADKDTFNKLINSFINMLKSFDCSISFLRSSEDNVYIETMHKLMKKLELD